ncbi:DNA polymerase III subunit beta [Fibrobacterales bacterium]|nr:DNA polymerase III subunit beta [Fibrobacterales bacterium]
MKFNAQKSALSPALSAAKFVIPSKPLIAISGCILLKLRGNNLEIFANDATGLGVSLTIEVEGQKDGEIAVLASDLTETISNAPDGLLNISVEKSAVTISWGEERDSNLQGYNSEDFIKIPEVEAESKVSLKVPTLDFLLSKVGFATSKSSGDRPALAGILLEAEENRLCAVSTDGFRLARIYLAPEENTEFALERARIIPPRAVQALLGAAKAAGDSENIVTMEFSETHLNFQTPNAKVISKLLEGPYPSWRPVIPSNTPITIKFNTKEALDVLQRISATADKQNHAARLSIENTEELKVSATGTRNTRDKIPCSCEYQGGDFPLNFGINVTYLIEVLKISNSEETVVLVNGEHSNCKILPTVNDDDILFLLMLLRK